MTSGRLLLEGIIGKNETFVTYSDKGNVQLSCKAKSMEKTVLGNKVVPRILPMNILNINY